MFITDPKVDPYLGRYVYLIFGDYGVGKTTMVLNMIEQHKDHYAYYVSADKGLAKIRDCSEASFTEKYKGRLSWAYPTTLSEWRVVTAELRDKVNKVKDKVPATKLWVILDTLTCMQTKLLAEARKLDVSKGNKKGGKIQDDDEIVRDLLTQVDYNVNLGHMIELTEALISLPCNVVLIALEKTATDKYDRKIAVPALSGQAADKIAGDCDVVARLVTEDNERKLLCNPGAAWKAKDRLGKLSSTEPADLWALHQKIVGQ